MPPPNKRTSPVEGTGPVPKNTLADEALGVEPILANTTAANLPGCVVLMITRYGTPRRRVYLDLGAARTAAARAREKGLHAELVLAKLEPVAADLDIDGGDQQ
jgi:hypothetical protein